MPYCSYGISGLVIYLVGGFGCCRVFMPVIQVSAFLFPVLAHCGTWTSRLVGSCWRRRSRHQEDVEEGGAKDVQSCGNRSTSVVHRGKVSRLSMWYSGDGHGLHGCSDTRVRHQDPPRAVLL